MRSSDTREIDTNLGHDELITAIELPPEQFSRNYSYLKIDLPFFL
jgi:xanthine dehydrogenase YagS FAD-binding subunit